MSPGSDSVFYDPHLSAGSPSTAIGSDKTLKKVLWTLYNAIKVIKLENQQPSPQGPEAPTNGDAYIVQPPEGFGDSPEGPKKPGGRSV